MRKGFIVLLLIICAEVSPVLSQTIEITADNSPLNKVLVDLRDKYGLKFSYNDQLLSDFNVTLNKNFPDWEVAISSLLKDLPLKYIKRNDVYVILSETEILQQKKYRLTGQIIEKGTNETLPFANVHIGDRFINCDLNGNFSFENSDSLFHVRISYLGHYNYDTIVPAGNNYQFKLIPSKIGLEEVIIEGKGVDKTTLIGERAGVMKINTQISRFLPGNDDNSVFNLLRLMPGVLASSEQSNGLVIWGSYEGLNQVSFDGFTIWGLKSFNDDINYINPLVTKDMEILKGGFDASVGDRVGGIIKITGKSGNYVKPSLTFNINNVTLNGLIETPLWRNTSVLLSFRKTYYNQFGDEAYSKDSTIEKNTGKSTRKKINQLVDYTVYPDYNFKDANLKFTTRNDKGDIFYISLLGGQDNYNYSINQVLSRSSLLRQKNEKNIQTGASAFYGNTWKNGNILNFTLSWSNLQTDYSDIQKIYGNYHTEILSQNNFTQNYIREYSASVDNWITLNKSHRIETGGGYIMNDIGLRLDSSGINQTSRKEISRRYHAFLQDHVSLPYNMNITFGLRGDFPLNLNRFYLQPRISLSIGLSEFLKINAAWGEYYQFITKASVVDELGNYRYIWTNCNVTDIPVLNSEHWIAGISHKKNNFTLGLETYYKNTTGLTRFITLNQDIGNNLHQGEGRSYGIDMFIRKDYKGHSAWISYTLSKTEEKFSYFPSNEFRAAPQDQRHELKSALILDLRPFSFSANYVFGSGFPLNATIFNPNPFEPDYNRLDVALYYRFRIKKLFCETGFSVINVLNSKNLRYSNFEKVPLDQFNSISIYSEAVPFSPRVSFKIAK